MLGPSAAADEHQCGEPELCAAAGIETAVLVQLPVMVDPDSARLSESNSVASSQRELTPKQRNVTSRVINAANMFHVTAQQSDVARLKKLLSKAREAFDTSDDLMFAIRFIAPKTATGNVLCISLALDLDFL